MHSTDHRCPTSSRAPARRARGCRRTGRHGRPGRTTTRPRVRRAPPRSGLRPVRARHRAKPRPNKPRLSRPSGSLPSTPSRRSTVAASTPAPSSAQRISKRQLVSAGTRSARICVRHACANASSGAEAKLDPSSPATARRDRGVGVCDQLGHDLHQVDPALGEVLAKVAPAHGADANLPMTRRARPCGRESTAPPGSAPVSRASEPGCSRRAPPRSRASVSKGAQRSDPRCPCGAEG